MEVLVMSYLNGGNCYGGMWMELAERSGCSDIVVWVILVLILCFYIKRRCSLCCVCCCCRCCYGDECTCWSHSGTSTCMFMEIPCN